MTEVLERLLRGWSTKLNLVFLRFVQLRAVENRIKESVDGIILDCGCGDGVVGNTLFGSNHFEKAISVGIDISRKMAKEAHLNNSYDFVLVADLRAIPFRDESFDSMVCIGVLEHIHECAKGLKEMARVGKKGTCTYITVPTDKHINGFVLPRLLNTFGAHNLFRKKVLELNIRYEICNPYSPCQWMSLLTRNGFRVVEAVSIMPMDALFFYNLLQMMHFLVSRIPTPMRLYVLKLIINSTDALRVNPKEAGNLCYVVKKH